MSTRGGVWGSTYSGPTLEDCQRAWDYLVTDFVTDLAIRIEFQAAKMPQFRARLVCWSPGIHPDTGSRKDYIWGTKELQPGYEAITYRQLYDLLMISHRQIELVLGGQEPLPLP
jgi:hypothetical protein